MTLLGALVVTAARLPLDILKALVPDYLAREKEVLELNAGAVEDDEL